MTSRERVLRAVNFKEIDRVPIDLGGMKASSIAVKAYNRVKEKLGLKTKTRIWDPKFMIASVERALMERFHLDVVPLDVYSVAHDSAPDSAWIPKTLYAGADGLLPPGTSIGAGQGVPATIKLGTTVPIVAPNMLAMADALRACPLTLRGASVSANTGPKATIAPAPL